MADNLVPGLDGTFSVYLWGFKDKSPKEITDIFSEFGDVVSVKQVNDCYFVRYINKEEAVKAIDAFANNRKVKVAAGYQKNKKTGENNVGPRNNNRDHDSTMRSNRSLNGQGNFKSPPHDRQVQDNRTGNRNGHNEGAIRKYRNHNQENDTGARNFQDQNGRKDDRNDQSHNNYKQRNVLYGLDDYSGEHSENRSGRRSDDFKSNGFSKQDSATSPKEHFNVHNKNRFSNGYSSTTDRFEKGWSDRNQSDKDSRKSQEKCNNYESNKSHMHKEVSDHKGQTNLAGNKTDHRSPKDHELPTRVAKEVIIADIPHEAMQADVYKLCGYVNPLHIDICRMKEDDIVYAHVFLRTTEDVNMLVEDLNGKKWCNNRMVVMAVEKVLRN